MVDFNANFGPLKLTKAMQPAAAEVANTQELPKAVKVGGNVAKAEVAKTESETLNTPEGTAKALSAEREVSFNEKLQNLRGAYLLDGEHANNNPNLPLDDNSNDVDEPLVNKGGPAPDIDLEDPQSKPTGHIGDFNDWKSAMYVVREGVLNGSIHEGDTFCIGGKRYEIYFTGGTGVRFRPVD